jgi:DNA helicase-2/ATP-dependent DNA helicase PcrA
VITIADLVRALGSFRFPPNAQQAQAVHAAPSAALIIVAGPGTGKTASLTLRILKLVLVDGVPPRGIFATSFSKKAAEELRAHAEGLFSKGVRRIVLPVPVPNSDRLGGDNGR